MQMSAEVGKDDSDLSRISRHCWTPMNNRMRGSDFLRIMYLHTRQKDDLHINNGPTFDLGSKGRVHYQQVVVNWFCHMCTG